MRVHILGRGPISLEFAKKMSSSFDFSIYSNNLTPQRDIQFKNYSTFRDISFQNSDSVIIAWRKLPQFMEGYAHIFQTLSECKNIVNLSSVAVYGNSFGKISESVEPRPINNYGFDKLEIEKFLSREFGSNVRHLRISNVFGSVEFEDVINRLTKAAMTNSKVNLVKPNLIKRDFISLESLILILSFILKNAEEIHIPQVVNVASGRSIYLMDLVKLIENAWDIRLDIDIQKISKEVIRESIIDIGRLTSFLNFKIVDEISVLEKYLKSSHGEDSS